MCEFIQTNKRWLLTATLTFIVLAAMFGVMGWKRTPAADPQEITLIAKDVVFYLADRPGEANPSIELTKGRPVKLILRNDEPEKILHCFTIGGLQVHSTRDLATGESEVLTFTPNESGTFAYACLMHQGMSGSVIVK